ncbi:MAG: DinB family protein [Candidatus Zixiibacteriota bacterium]
MPIQELSRLFAYNHWANCEVVKRLITEGRSPSRAIAIFAHIIAAERLWWHRLHNAPSSVAVWPEFTANECERQLPELRSMWQTVLGGADEVGLTRSVSYKNSKGEPFTSNVGDILLHVIMHGSYHRGQIASILRQAGHEPSYTDFIHAVRNGYVH